VTGSGLHSGTRPIQKTKEVRLVSGWCLTGLNRSKTTLNLLLIASPEIDEMHDDNLSIYPKNFYVA
jgi:hypothetical protein